MENSCSGFTGRQMFVDSQLETQHWIQPTFPLWEVLTCLSLQPHFHPMHRHINPFILGHIKITLGPILFVFLDTTLESHWENGGITHDLQSHAQEASHWIGFSPPPLLATCVGGNTQDLIHCKWALSAIWKDCFCHAERRSHLSLKGQAVWGKDVASAAKGL